MACLMQEDASNMPCTDITEKGGAKATAVLYIRTYKGDTRRILLARGQSKIAPYIPIRRPQPLPSVVPSTSSYQLQAQERPRAGSM